MNKVRCHKHANEILSHVPSNAAPSSTFHESLAKPQHKHGTSLETEHGLNSKYRHAHVNLEPQGQSASPVRARIPSI